MSISEGSYTICLICGTSATCVGVWEALVVYRSQRLVRNLHSNRQNAWLGGNGVRMPHRDACLGYST